MGNRKGNRAAEAGSRFPCLGPYQGKQRATHEKKSKEGKDRYSQHEQDAVLGDRASYGAEVVRCLSCGWHAVIVADSLTWEHHALTHIHGQSIVSKFPRYSDRRGNPDHFW